MIYFLIQIPINLLIILYLFKFYKNNGFNVYLAHCIYFFIMVSLFLLITPFAYEIDNLAYIYLFVQVLSAYYIITILFFQKNYINTDITMHLFNYEKKDLIIFMIIYIIIFLFKYYYNFQSTDGIINAEARTYPYIVSIVISIFSSIEIVLLIIFIRDIILRGANGINITGIFITSVAFLIPSFVTLGTRRAIALVIVVLFTTFLSPSKKQVYKLFFIGLISIFFIGYYQTIRNNINDYDIINNIASENYVNKIQGIYDFLTTIDKIESNQINYRATVADNFYEVVKSYLTTFNTTQGSVLLDTFRWLIPGFLIDKGSLKGADAIVFEKLNIRSGNEITLSSDVDYASSLMSELVADFGILGVIIAPFLMIFSIYYALKKANYAYFKRAKYENLIYISLLVSIIGSVEYGILGIFLSLRNLISIYILFLLYNKLRN